MIFIFIIRFEVNIQIIYILFLSFVTHFHRRELTAAMRREALPNTPHINDASPQICAILIDFIKMLSPRATAAISLIADFCAWDFNLRHASIYRLGGYHAAADQPVCCAAWWIKRDCYRAVPARKLLDWMTLEGIYITTLSCHLLRAVISSYYICRS